MAQQLVGIILVYVIHQQGPVRQFLQAVSDAVYLDVMHVVCIGPEFSAYLQHFPVHAGSESQPPVKDVEVRIREKTFPGNADQADTFGGNLVRCLFPCPDVNYVVPGPGQRHSFLPVNAVIQ
jgi:hypothetical protein